MEPGPPVLQVHSLNHWTIREVPKMFSKALCQQTSPGETVKNGNRNGKKMLPFLRESIPRQIDNKSKVPKEEKGVWGSRSRDWGSGIIKEEKRTTFFALYIP